MSSNRTVLYVSGFSVNLRARDLAYEFERYGRLIRCDIPALKTPSSAPFAFIEFRRPDDAEDAYYDMHGRSIDGRRVMIQWAKRPPSAGWRHEAGGRPPRDDRDRRDDRRDDRRRSPSPRRGDRDDRRDDRRRSPSPRRGDRDETRDRDRDDDRDRRGGDRRSASPGRKVTDADIEMRGGSRDRSRSPRERQRERERSPEGRNGNGHADDGSPVKDDA